MPRESWQGLSSSGTCRALLVALEVLPGGSTRSAQFAGDGWLAAGAGAKAGLDAGDACSVAAVRRLAATGATVRSGIADITLELPSMILESPASTGHGFQSLQ